MRHQPCPDCVVVHHHYSQMLKGLKQIMGREKTTTGSDELHLFQTTSPHSSPDFVRIQPNCTLHPVHPAEKRDEDGDVSCAIGQV